MNIRKNAFSTPKDALKASLQAGTAHELALLRNNGPTNCRLSAKERANRKVRNRLAQQSRRSNRR